MNRGFFEAEEKTTWRTEAFRKDAVIPSQRENAMTGRCKTAERGGTDDVGEPRGEGKRRTEGCPKSVEREKDQHNIEKG